MLPLGLWRKLAFIVGSILVVLFVIFFFRLFPALRHEEDEPSLNLSVNQPIEDFFWSYWRLPIPLQGQPPPDFTKIEASLRPEACGSCHPQQYADWKESLHSKAMGPGPWGQIIDFTQNSPGDAILCMTCHAPLSEQIPFVAKTADGNNKSYENNPAFDSHLQLQGITCAACHVRQHQRFGPPRVEGADPNKYPSGTANHGGVQRTPYFEKAEFCRDCHQFDPKKSVLINGKPLQDTFREWQNSIWGKGGAGCQECHMSNRRHLWKGIHDAEWVRGGVRMENQVTRLPGGSLELLVEITNSAVGHKFPTYITPKVFVRAALLGQNGKALPGTEREKTIGWDARFEDGRWKEYFDTRIAPGDKFQQTFRWTPTSQARKIRAWIEVHPDHFYHVHFHPEYLKSQELTSEGRKLIEKALRDSGRASYILFERLIPLN